MADRFVKDPHEVVKAGDVVRVRVVEVDVPRKRIGLTMRKDAGAADARPQERGGTAQPRGATPAQAGKGAGQGGRGQPGRGAPKPAPAAEKPGTGALGAALLDALRRKE